jgi:biopolymer transport protein ExbD
VNLRPRRQEEPDINLTPLIDVVFLLLIFFMVSTTFRKEADLKVNLPESSEAVSPVEREQLTITIDAEGRYAVNGEALVDTRLETLKSAISGAAGARRDLPLVIRADGNTPHQAVVKAMDAAGQSGFRQLGIATIQASPRSGQGEGEQE